MAEPADGDEARHGAEREGGHAERARQGVAARRRHGDGAVEQPAGQESESDAEGVAAPSQRAREQGPGEGAEAPRPRPLATVPRPAHGRAEALYTRQDLGPYRTPGSPPYFWTTNLLLGYEFPRKWGLIEVGALNLTRERFQLRPDAVFLSESLITRIRDPRTFTNRDIVPDRSYFVRLTLNL